jgi:hypothetical protein
MVKTPEGRGFGMGKTVGNGVQGWAPSAFFVHSDGSFDINTNTTVYINVGTVTAASWMRINDPQLLFPLLAQASYFVDDFNQNQNITYTETDDGGTGAAAISTTLAWGIMSVATSADDNDGHYLTTPQPVADLSAGLSFYYEARLKLTEANTDDANWWCGLIINADIAGMIGDNGAGPAADYDGCGFFKVDGGTTINFEQSDATVQQTQEMGDFSSGLYHRLGMHWNGNISTLTPYLDGVAGTGIICASSVAAYMAGFGVKAGDTNVETLLVDYHKCLMWPDDGSR